MVKAQRPGEKPVLLKGNEALLLVMVKVWRVPTTLPLGSVNQKPTCSPGVKPVTVMLNWVPAGPLVGLIDPCCVPAVSQPDAGGGGGGLPPVLGVILNQTTDWLPDV